MVVFISAVPVWRSGVCIIFRVEQCPQNLAGRLVVRFESELLDAPRNSGYYRLAAGDMKAGLLAKIVRHHVRMLRDGSRAWRDRYKTIEQRLHVLRFAGRIERPGRDESVVLAADVQPVSVRHLLVRCVSDLLKKTGHIARLTVAPMEKVTLTVWNLIT